MFDESRSEFLAHTEKNPSKVLHKHKGTNTVY